MITEKLVVAPNVHGRQTDRQTDRILPSPYNGKFSDHIVERTIYVWEGFGVTATNRQISQIAN